MANPFLQNLMRAGAGFAAGMAPPHVGQFVFDQLNRQRELERQREALDPFRQAVLAEIRGPRNTFSGGPMSDFQGIGPSPAGPPTAVQEVQPGMQQGGPQAIQARPLPQQLPAGLAPPPQIDTVLQQAARQHGVPVNALRAIAAQESSFNPQAVNQPTPGDPTDPGARGLFQFTEATAGAMGIDPFNIEQTANATAQMLASELAKGASLEEAMTAHFGGPDRSLWGPKTQQYMQDITAKFRALEQAAPEAAPAAPIGGEQRAPGQSIGPFGTTINEQQQQPQGFGQRLLEIAAQDPDSFTQLFSGEGGIKQIADLLQQGGGFTGTLSEGQKAFVDGQVVAENVGKDNVRARVYGGDSAIGRSLGIPLGERARVEETFDENGNVVSRNVVGRFGAGQEININSTGPDAFEKANAQTINDAVARVMEAGETAESMLPNLRRSGELLVEGLNTGRAQALLLPIRQFAQDLAVPIEEAAQSLGIDIGGSRLADQEEFDRLAKQVVLDSYAKTKGNLNAQEATVVEQSVNNFGRSEEANMRAIAALQAAAEVAAERRRQALSQATDLSSARTFLSNSASSGAEAVEQRMQQILGGMMESKVGPTAAPTRTQQPASQSTGAPPDVQAVVPEGMVLGAQTADGRWEVRDSSGNLAGYIEP